MVSFKEVKHCKGVPLFMNSMLSELSLQRLHIRRECHSDPLVDGGVFFIVSLVRTSSTSSQMGYCSVHGSVVLFFKLKDFLE